MRLKKFADWVNENAMINKTSIDNTGNFINSPVAEDDEGRESNYMFFANLRRIQDLAKMILAMDKEEIDELLNNGHDWANDHITTAKTNLDHVFGFLKGEAEDINDSKKITEGVHDTSELHRQFSMDPTWWAAWRMENEKELGLKIEKDSFSKTYEVKDKDDKVLFIFDYKRSKVFTNESPNLFTLKDEMTTDDMQDAKDKSKEIKDDLAGIDPNKKEEEGGAPAPGGDEGGDEGSEEKTKEEE
jgi:hypothetical protein